MSVQLAKRPLSFSVCPTGGSSRYTWSSRESLDELQQPQRVAQIKLEHELRKEIEKKKHQANQTLIQVFVAQDNEESCLICHL